MSKSVIRRLGDAVSNLISFGKLQNPHLGDETVSSIADRVRDARESDPDTVPTILARFERPLRESGNHKFLGFSYYHVGNVEKAFRYVRRLPDHDLDERERLLAERIRYEWSVERRHRYGIPIPSNKPVGRRVFDGIRNALRYGRVWNPHIVLTRTPKGLLKVTSQIREARHSDVRLLGELLTLHEAAYKAIGHEKFLAFSYYHAGNLTKAAEYAHKLEPAGLSQDELTLRDNILFEMRALRRLRAGKPPVHVESNNKHAEVPEKPRALYLAASSLPYVVSGYTSRSEAIIDTFHNSDRFSLVPLTRPGFPADRPDAKPVKPLQNMATFDCLPSKLPFRGDLENYLRRALPLLERWARKRDVNLVHGVSNYRNGVIGFALARRMGIPFVYEVRGLWEETTDSKLSGWRDTERFEYERSFETWLFAQADGALTINDQVRRILDTGCRDNVRLLPNCVAKDRIIRRPHRTRAACLRVGYIGSLIEYEGLADVLQAIARFQDDGRSVRFDVYGQGQDRKRLQTLTRRLKLRDVTFHGLVEPNVVTTLYGQFDLCIFARRPHRVCQLVTPLKPIEAMANDVNVIMSDVPPLADLAVDGSALTFEAGNVDSLVEAIERFMALDDDEAAAIRQSARDALLARYVWERQEVPIADVYRGACSVVGSEAAG